MILHMLVTVLLSLIAVEYFIRMPFLFHVKSLINIVQKSSHMVVSKRISDHWKEIVLLRYSRDLLIHAMIIFLIMVGCFLLVVLSALFVDWFFNYSASIIEYISGSPGIIVMTISAILYVFIRQKLVFFRL